MLLVQGAIGKEDEEKAQGKGEGKGTGEQEHTAQPHPKQGVQKHALLEMGADANKATPSGFTPLFIAAQNGHADVARALLAMGADASKARQDGWTPLDIAAANGHTSVVLVLGGGAD